ncbi:hypothetical protein PCANC_08797 [Puccinia coronata f. sp. avenae]|uniref:Uncharacterized protein n=1 Tax=Puccinia coronata f. sp. avenae TaxID=200324 RepID=A0A2N5V867_9BASI|nr:hypothetical protein PCANC_08797 [Puccinia coronata f. sp. avenae]
MEASTEVVSLVTLDDPLPQYVGEHRAKFCQCCYTGNPLWGDFLVHFGGVLPGERIRDHIVFSLNVLELEVK